MLCGKDSARGAHVVRAGSRRSCGRWPAVGLCACLLAGCAGLAPDTSPRAQVVHADVPIRGVPRSLTWTLPTGAATALVTLQHGYARRCANLSETARQLALRGLLVLCIDAPMAQGNPELADDVAAWLVSDPPGPSDEPLPQRVIVSGHSAGAVFAARLGARLDALAPQRLGGALLFDPVSARGLAADLLSVSRAGQRPVLAIAAAASPCNGEHNAYAALRSVRDSARAAGADGFVGVELTDGSIHTDVEGEQSDWVAIAACGRPVAQRTQTLRTLAAQWASEMAGGAPPTHGLPESAHAIE